MELNSSNFHYVITFTSWIFPFFKVLQLNRHRFYCLFTNIQTLNQSHITLFSLFCSRFIDLLRIFHKKPLIAQFLISTTENSFIVIAQETSQWAERKFSLVIFRIGKFSIFPDFPHRKRRHFLSVWALSIFCVCFPRLFRQNRFEECFLENFSDVRVVNVTVSRFSRKSHFVLNRFSRSNFRHERELRFGLLMMFTITKTNEVKLGAIDFGSALNCEEIEGIHPQS